MGKQFDNLKKGTGNMSSGFNSLLNTKNESEPIKQSEKEDLKSVNFNSIPKEIHKYLKNKATEEGRPMAAIILDAVVSYYGLEDLTK